METKFLVESFCSNLVSFVKIDNLPSLVGIVILVSILTVNHDLLAFLVFATIDLKNLVVVWIDKEFSLQLEDLEPSRVCAPDLHVSSFSSALYIP